MTLSLWGIEIMDSEKKQYDDFLLMNVNNLSDYFTVRGISVSAYNKIELVAGHSLPQKWTYQ